MSPPLNEDKQAAALARWLDAGGRGGPPDGMDEDVIEAVLALRPELAPAPDLDLDDLLGSIEVGPFAAGGDLREGGEVVPFPVPASLPEDADEEMLSEVLPAPTPLHRPWWRQWAAGGMAGTLAAAAAVLIVVTSDSTQLTLPDLAAPLARQRSESPKEKLEEAASDEKKSAYGDAQEQIPETRAAPAAPQAAKPTVTEPSGAPLDKMDLSSSSRDLPGSGGIGKKGAFEPSPTNTGTYGGEDQGNTYGRADAEPAALQQTGGQWAPDVIQAADDDAIADGYVEGELDASLQVPEEEQIARSAPAGTASGAGSAAEGPRSRKVSAEQRNEAPAAPPVTTGASRAFDPTDGWRASVDEATAARIDSALQLAAGRASRGSPRTAALDLRPYIQAPARAGQAVAVQAARYALQAGDGTLAQELVDLGLALGGTGTQEQGQLLALRDQAVLAKRAAADAARALEAPATDEAAEPAQ